MIKSLRIDNFALIERVDLNFNEGFTVLTGETGSGKSILLNALNLILGERADFSVIGNAKDKAVVELEIDVSGFNMKMFFEENDLDYFESTILRREVSKQGRSRAFINDTPVQLQVLKSLSSGLIQIHSQYDTLELRDQSYQLKVLDVLADAENLKAKYHLEFRKWKQLKSTLAEKQEKFLNLKSAKDYNEFQLNELLELKLEEIDYTEIVSALNNAENAEEIRTSMSMLLEAIQSESGVFEQIAAISKGLSRFSADDKNIESVEERLTGIMHELKDLEHEALSCVENLNISQQEISELSTKVDLYSRALHKHNVDNQEELLAKLHIFRDETSNTDTLEVEIGELKNRIEEVETRVVKCAEELSIYRRSNKNMIEDAIGKELNQLKLPETKIEFKISRLDEFSIAGVDKVELFFSPNKGVEPTLIHKAASGGELSRVMLGIQHLMSSKVKLKSILFDEIDTGVSGDVAQRVGETLLNMGKKMQVLAITHLPQVAAKGQTHFKVSKSSELGVAKTSVDLLNIDQRVEETARLMSGKEINEAALVNARELMN